CKVKLGNLLSTPAKRCWNCGTVHKVQSVLSQTMISGADWDALRLLLRMIPSMIGTGVIKAIDMLLTALHLV
ncbi:hypothetical protein Q6293_28000, partial [Klebsiella pneumoniae]|uniref:hypothetical protein n=1 Tax=Klebsiella pneumoniae TaxID=573 RepID=UPI00272F5A9F